MVIRKIGKAVGTLTGPNWKNQRRGLTIGRELQEFRRVFKDNFVTLIVSAFGVVAALSWNDALKEVIFVFFPEKGDLIVKVYTAVAVTILSIVVTYLLSKLKTKTSSN
ncbi:MAG: hypothetical protein HYS62_02655 [Candidatus Aenigmarchaeota archaeon]|nr:hypothetical protein [Candidatus Aenigmarchaeota archaeon]